MQDCEMEPTRARLKPPWWLSPRIICYFSIGIEMYQNKVQRYQHYSSDLANNGNYCSRATPARQMNKRFRIRILDVYTSISDNLLNRFNFASGEGAEFWKLVNNKENYCSSTKNLVLRTVEHILYILLSALLPYAQFLRELKFFAEGFDSLHKD